MSIEVKRLRSTACRDMTDTSPSVTNFNQSWDRLPMEMAVHIYKFLPMNDKYYMSLTCKFWSAAFRHPKTWRYSHFLFTGNKSSTLDIPDDVFPSLQFVTIDCSAAICVVSEKYLMEKTERLITFVVKLNESRNTTLQELNILDMKDLGNHVTSTLHNHLSTLLAKQTKLSRLSFYNGGFETEQGLQLLTAAGQNSAHCLKYLNVRNFSKQTMFAAPEFTFAELCGTFTNVTELSLTCGFMSDHLLNNLSGTLKLIIVWVHMTDFDYPSFDHKYTDNGWSMLVSKCTGLKAEYHLYDQHIDVKLSWILLPSVPLASLHLHTEGLAQGRIIRWFDHIIKNCKNRLEHLHVDGGINILSERDVVAVVECCPLLKTFSISGLSMPIEFISQLKEIQVNSSLYIVSKAADKVVVRWQFYGNMTLEKQKAIIESVHKYLLQKPASSQINFEADDLTPSRIS